MLRLRGPDRHEVLLERMKTMKVEVSFLGSAQGLESEKISLE